jgi:hypothetical protein
MKKEEQEEAKINTKKRTEISNQKTHDYIFCYLIEKHNTNLASQFHHPRIKNNNNHKWVKPKRQKHRKNQKFQMPIRKKQKPKNRAQKIK